MVKGFSIPLGIDGSKLFPLRKIPIMKRGAIEENHYLILWSPFDLRNVFSVLATLLVGTGYVR